MIRIIFLLLVLGNLAFFAWDRYLRVPVSAEAHIEQVQITPEKIRIVESKAARTPVAKPAAPVEAPNVADTSNAASATKTAVAC
jgi:hypothetical protein